ncbi:MOSC domain-containing protein [soil metagenome]
MYLSEINIYPIKSLGGISLERSVVEERGLQFDRRWMLVDEKNEFLTQREFPKMATISVKIQENNLSVVLDNEEKLISLEPNTAAAASVKIWQSRCRAKVYESEINNWFSDVLQTNCKLVLMPDEVRRAVNPFYAVRKFKDVVSFADGYPFLLIGENSLDELNSRLEKPLPMNRFRPNFVVSGPTAFAEDDWKKLKIGNVVFYVVKPCARCVITTIDQETGVSDGKEPLKTLASFRQKRQKILFGQNLIAENFGETLRVGDAVEILA